MQAEAEAKIHADMHVEEMQSNAIKPPAGDPVEAAKAQAKELARKMREAKKKRKKKRKKRGK